MIEVRTDMKNKTEAFRWCREQYGGPFSFNSSNTRHWYMSVTFDKTKVFFHFKKIDDAIQFKLVWDDRSRN